MEILVVTGNSRRVDELQKLLPKHTVYGCFRDYHLDAMLGEKPDLVLSDYTCRSRHPEYGPYGIWLDVRPHARNFGLTVHSLDTFEKGVRMMRWVYKRFGWLPQSAL